MMQIEISTPSTKVVATLLVMLGIGVGIATLLWQRPDEPLAEPRQPAISATPIATTSANANPLKDIPDIFAVRSWAPPPPPPLAANPAPPPPPQAPALPFKYVGQIDDGPRGRTFILADSQRVYTLSPGDSIDERYRLEKFENGQLHFMYLPMSIRQALSIGNSL